LKALILAGGYAKRMWPLTRSLPKPLLQIGGKPAIDYVLDRLLETRIDSILVSTNEKFKHDFQAWRAERSVMAQIEIAAEASKHEDEKLGAVRAIAELAPRMEPDDYMILAGDNIFTSSLNGMIDFYNQKKASVVAVTRATSIEEVVRGSSVLLDGDMKITHFEEKPKEPKSMLIGACIYVMSHRTLLRTGEYLKEGGKSDEPGNFIAWLCVRQPVYGYMLKGRIWDIGTAKDYQQAQSELSLRKAGSPD